jgi:hypothetical protein
MGKDGKPIKTSRLASRSVKTNRRRPIRSGQAGLESTAEAYRLHLVLPDIREKFYLIDMDGKLVKEWDTDATPAAHVMLLPSGNFLRPCVWQIKGGAGGGGAGGRIQEISWDGALVWDYSCPPNKRQHHDCLKLPNGNVLMPVWDTRSAQDCAEAGRRGGGGNISFDSIIEVRPSGMSR